MFRRNAGRRGSCRGLRVVAAAQNELAAADAQLPGSQLEIEQPQQSYFSLPRLHSPYDAEIGAIALPALASLVLDPVMNLVNSGKGELHEAVQSALYPSVGQVILA